MIYQDLPSPEINPREVIEGVVHCLLCVYDLLEHVRTPFWNLFVVASFAQVLSIHEFEHQTRVPLGKASCELGQYQ